MTKGEGMEQSLIHSTASTCSQRLRHLFAVLHLRYSTSIAAHVTQWDLSTSGNGRLNFKFQIFFVSVTLDLIYFLQTRIGFKLASLFIPVWYMQWEKQPPEVFYKKDILKSFAILTGNQRNIANNNEYISSEYITQFFKTAILRIILQGLFLQLLTKWASHPISLT